MLFAHLVGMVVFLAAGRAYAKTGEFQAILLHKKNKKGTYLLILFVVYCFFISVELIQISSAIHTIYDTYLHNLTLILCSELFEH